MKAVILCAGEGERMKPATSNTPKPLLLVGDKPILFFIFNSLPSDITEVFLIIQEKYESLFKEFLQEFEIKIEVSILFQNKEKWGTCHALNVAKDYLKDEDIFLVLNGDDIFLKEDLEKILKSKVPTYGISYKKISPRYRTCDTKDNKIISFREQKEEEKGKMIPCFSGALTLNKDFFSFCPVYINSEAGIPDTLFSAKQDVSFVLLKEWIQINTNEDLILAQNKINGV